MEEFVHQLKTNRTVRYATVGATAVVAYLTGGLWGVILTVAGFVLGRLSYNDAIEDMEV
ncbi:MAG: hypothetical protein OSB18_14870 [SAR324 cluster bacterium]|jgi:hypothetical protein|nr:hypothetical protein [SAR324 cluster bacterium]|tara:strand:- start:4853 stop:5029 length:177 start_codon:yes stop_codon:yes gene_type:complete